MAQRFGGKFSPNQTGSDQTDPDKTGLNQSRSNQPGPWIDADTAPSRQRVGFKAGFLFFLPFIFFLKAFFGDPSSLFVSLGTGGLLLLAAWLTRDGIRAQQAYDARRVARRPAIPRKLFAAALTGAAFVLASMGTSVVYPFLFGLLGAFLHIGAFGLDPMRGKGLEGVDQFQTDRVARAVEEGEQYLAGMKDAILRANDPKLEQRIDRFAAIARGLFRTIEGDPGDLTAARKYLSVYLMGARDATIKFADVYAQNKSPTARSDYEALLTDLETNFAARTKALLNSNHTDLDVEIQVLRDRLKLEG